jgi:hypothetical protein
MPDSYTQDKWNAINTVQDFLSFCEDPQCDTQNFFTSLIDINQSSFWHAGNVDFDIDIEDLFNDETEKKEEED